MLQHLDKSSEGKRNDRHTIHPQFHNGLDILLALHENDERPQERQMIPTWGYLPLVSKDKLTLVQIFTDLATGEHIRVTVATRRAPWLTWSPPTEVEKT